MKKTLIRISLLAILLAGCSKLHQVKSYEYYSKHLDEARIVSAGCKDIDQSDENIRKDCSNAAEALSARLFKNGTTTMPKYGANGLSGS